MMVFTGLSAFAQKATLSGAVKDASTQEEIIGANVVIKELGTGRATDIFGNYTIDLDAGTYTVSVSYIGYKSLEKSVTITAGQAQTLNFDIDADAEQLDEVVVQGKANRESSEALMVQRQNADVMIQSIGAEEMSVKGISNVEGALTKVTGISKVGSKGVFVRGLGDRYNNVFLNGLPVPSTNPDKKVADLSMFPSVIVRNLNISKTFSPELYGDFSGATANIETKDYAEDPFFNISIGSGYNSLATFNDFYLNSDGDMEFLGVSGNGRTMPEGMLDRSQSFYEQDALDLFSTNLAPTQGTALPQVNLKISGGTSYDVGEEGVVGFVAGANFGNDYSYREGDFKTIYNPQGFYRQSNYDLKRWAYNTNSSAFANFYYEINRNNILRFNNMMFNETSNEYEELYGKYYDGEGKVLNIRNTYKQNTVTVNQLLGEHKFNEERIVLDWGVAYNTAVGSEPDRKQLFFEDITEIAGQPDFSNIRLNVGDKPDFNNRFWSESNEVEYAANFGTKIGIGQRLTETDDFQYNVRLGYQGRFKNRDFNYYQVFYNRDISGGRNQYVDLSNLDQDLNGMLESGELYISSLNRYDTEFEANQNINSYFASVDADILPSKLKVNVGVRMESESREIFYYEFQTSDPNAPLLSSEYDKNVVLPSLNLKYSLNERSNLRVAASKTVTRPGFREVLPFQYQEAVGGATILGNEELQNSFSQNLDLKYEIFPNSGEIISVGAFGKILENPIAMVALPADGNLFTYNNLTEAQVVGLEFEFTKQLASLIPIDSKLLDNTSVGLNGTYLYSYIDATNILDQTTLTNVENQLQGASPYLINADISYSALWNSGVESIFTLTYNTFGDRIYSLATDDAPDIYEKGYGTLNLIWKNKIKDNFSINLAVRNILNPDIITYQDFGIYNVKFTDGSTKTNYTYGVDPTKATRLDDVANEIFVESADKIGETRKTVTSYKKGLDFSVSLSYTF
ncbi:outer membrane receptor protein involved in Fe transport [Sediminitomix flava]|uniref:Outer membrane receptor protein involved in Fe transport n=1 Tax=Sediminitomix flava TaxID=379075 RepID=A0A315ZF93_SEDFL|nr:outer membrane receptor protein involved in Fe transport [Sediminitomix flava]